MAEGHDEQEFRSAKQDLESAYTVRATMPRIRVRLENWSRERDRQLRDGMAEQRRAVLPWIYRASNFPDSEINQRVGTTCLITLVDYLREGFEIRVGGERLVFFDTLLAPPREERPLSTRVEERYREVFTETLTRVGLPHLQARSWRARRHADYVRKLIKRQPLGAERSDPKGLDRWAWRKTWARRRVARSQDVAEQRRERELVALQQFVSEAAAAIHGDPLLALYADELVERLREYARRAGAPVEGHLAVARLAAGLEAFDIWHYDRRNPPRLPKGWRNHLPDVQAKAVEAFIEEQSAGSVPALHHYLRALRKAISRDPLLAPHLDAALRHTSFLDASEQPDDQRFNEMFKRLDHWTRAGAYEQARCEVSEAANARSANDTTIPWHLITPEQRDEIADLVVSRLYSSAPGQPAFRNFFAAAVTPHDTKPPYPLCPLARVNAYHPETGEPDASRFRLLIRRELDNLRLIKWSEARAKAPNLARPDTLDPQQPVPRNWFTVLPRDNEVFPFKVPPSERKRAARRQQG